MRPTRLVPKLKENLDDASSDVGQLRNDLDTAQSQLKDTEAAVQQLTTELEKAKGEREASQSQINALSKTGDEATAQLKRMTADRDTTQSRFDENQSQLDAMKVELSKANEVTEQAKANRNWKTRLTQPRKMRPSVPNSNPN